MEDRYGATDALRIHALGNFWIDIKYTDSCQAQPIGLYFQDSTRVVLKVIAWWKPWIPTNHCDLL
jgi:hypothetical protein